MKRLRGGRPACCSRPRSSRSGSTCRRPPVMVIENAERFGLAQLHQLRGRVGRGTAAPVACVALHGRLSDDARAPARGLRVALRRFPIAEADLEIRGPGDLLGTRQSGMPRLRLADPVARPRVGGAGARRRPRARRRDSTSPRSPPGRPRAGWSPAQRDPRLSPEADRCGPADRQHPSSRRHLRRRRTGDPARRRSARDGSRRRGFWAGGPEGARGPKTLFPLAVVPCPADVRWPSSAPRRAGARVRRRAGGGARGDWSRRGARRHAARRALQVSYGEELAAVRPLGHGAGAGRPGGVERRFRWFKTPLRSCSAVFRRWLVDRVLAPSRRTAAELERDYGVRRRRRAAERHRRSRAGRRPSRCRTPKRRRADLLFVGRLRLRKGVEVRCRRSRDRERRGSRPRLLIVGEGEHRGGLEGRASVSGWRRGSASWDGRRRSDACSLQCRALVVPVDLRGHAAGRARGDGGRAAGGRQPRSAASPRWCSTE